MNTSGSRDIWGRPTSEEHLPSHADMKPRNGPVAVVDIGSNSVRLVIYEAMLTRAPADFVHNEKAICAIGRDMVTTGQLHREGMKLALEALARFRMLADANRVEAHEAVATAAARDAGNGQEFIRQAETSRGKRADPHPLR